MLKFSKILVLIAVASFFTITIINNIIDYEKTFAFIQHTLSMDTTAQNPHFMGRAISNPILQHIAFITIIIAQIIIALLCWYSIVQMIQHRKADTAKFMQAKQCGIVGCSLGFVLYSLGFLTIAGQWFMMRESTVWNVQSSVLAFITFFGISMIYLYLSERD